LLPEAHLGRVNHIESPLAQESALLAIIHDAALVGGPRGDVEPPLVTG